MSDRANPTQWTITKDTRGYRTIEALRACVTASGVQLSAGTRVTIRTIHSPYVEVDVGGNGLWVYEAAVRKHAAD